MLKVEHHAVYALVVGVYALNVFVKTYVYLRWFLCPVFIQAYIDFSPCNVSGLGRNKEIPFFERLHGV